jgi:hypothetical protein
LEKKVGAGSWRPTGKSGIPKGDTRDPEFTCSSVESIISLMSTAHEIEEAIRTLPVAERDKLLRHLPALFPELAGDAEWDRIVQDERPRPDLSRLLDETQEQLRRDPSALPKIEASDFVE